MSTQLKLSQHQLLLVSATGSIPNFTQLFRRLDLKATLSSTLRNALIQIKKHSPTIIIAEFVYAPTYGSQLSNFESLLAAVQSYSAESNFIALVYPDDVKHCKKVLENSSNFLLVTLPVTEKELESHLKTIIASE